MDILIDRRWKKDTYTIGDVYIDGTWACNSLEDRDRGLDQSMTLEEIRSRKVYGQTAIPTGRYEVRMDVVSGLYSSKAWYVRNCHGGRMPRIMDTKGFQGVLVHCGNSAKDTLGCILVGLNTVKGGLTQSRATFLPIYRKMWDAYKRGEKIWLTIK